MCEQGTEILTLAPRSLLSLHFSLSLPLDMLIPECGMPSPAQVPHRPLHPTPRPLRDTSQMGSPPEVQINADIYQALPSGCLKTQNFSLLPPCWGTCRPLSIHLLNSFYCRLTAINPALRGSGALKTKEHQLNKSQPGSKQKNASHRRYIL